MTTLTIKNLSKIYKGRYVVNNISLYITSGEIVGLLGPNGSGKTTTFYMILGIVQHNSGSISIGEKDISMLPIYRRARLGIGYLPQESSIFRRLTVFDNLMAILQTRRNLNTKKRNKLIIELMNNFHISHLKNNIGQTLSGGERKRVEIARALAANPKFILLDEPFSGVDPISITDIQKIIQQLKSRKLGVLITDHNVRETLRICERAYIVNQGQSIAHGSPNEILNNKHVQQVYLGDIFKL
ncbi:LPS export ABC transporter ATP-binding protein [Candidatus Blochmanniella camponoti]|uniref:Lipopolysaccharide export system ATP-binding protein LptB n=1 Tax=Candidatus Blochmanniella camponoti TaxID=108080 RepID=A0AAE9L5T6_9ENTR|nr:LPS export ABC transporter ATP-binding protein [Candidatus Blochmannia herculeanus]URJ24489.1 LPS export ABC transporter ATP-binding protein [Candidatus Blochmannia herculeanus]URJ26903.1 LPS export ABC transporter ATP-binding protein [Candidatus Blochmannia herculeanus]URJ27294.1 LPS export ABC transporter ATP-binding protein [Candidatus Blochmannia herculeanus]